MKRADVFIVEKRFLILIQEKKKRKRIVVFIIVIVFSLPAVFFAQSMSGSTGLALFVNPEVKEFRPDKNEFPKLFIENSKYDPQKGSYYIVDKGRGF